MTRNRLRLSIYVAAALLAVGGGARYTINIGGSTAVSGWQLTFGLPAGVKLSSSWDTAFTTFQG